MRASWSNCIIWAYLLHKRRKRKGREGYMMFRTSRLLKFGPHALYAERRTSGTWRIVSYVPRDPVRRKCPPPFFRGKSKWGDLR